MRLKSKGDQTTRLYNYGKTKYRKLFVNSKRLTGEDHVGVDLDIVSLDVGFGPSA